MLASAMSGLGRAGRGALWGAGIAVLVPITFAVIVPSLQSMAARGINVRVVAAAAAVGALVAITRGSDRPQ